MTNYENIKSMSLSGLASFLCGLFPDTCKVCPVFEECEVEDNGFKKWLKKEAEE